MTVALLCVVIALLAWFGWELMQVRRAVDTLTELDAMKRRTTREGLKKLQERLKARGYRHSSEAS